VAEITEIVEITLPDRSVVATTAEPDRSVVATTAEPDRSGDATTEPDRSEEPTIEPDRSAERVPDKSVGTALPPSTEAGVVPVAEQHPDEIITGV